MVMASSPPSTPLGIRMPTDVARTSEQEQPGSVSDFVLFHSAPFQDGLMVHTGIRYATLATAEIGAQWCYVSRRINDIADQTIWLASNEPPQSIVWNAVRPKDAAMLGLTVEQAHVARDYCRLVDPAAQGLQDPRISTGRQE